MLDEFPEFDLDRNPVFFTGEMIYPWMFDQFACLEPMKEAAFLLADQSDWPRLYDADVLKENSVPCAASVYCDDMYVDINLSLETARHIKGIKLWITNEHEHDGIRVDGEAVLDRLLSMLRGDR